MELSFKIISFTELDYDDVSQTSKRIIPALDNIDLSHTYIRDDTDTETDTDSKTAVKSDLIDKGYIWTSEV